MKNSFLILSIIFVIVFSSYFEVVDAQYMMKNFPSQDKMLKDEKHQVYVNEVKENTKQYLNLRMDLTCIGYDKKSVDECVMKKFMKNQVYFWLLLAVFSALAVGIFLYKTKSNSNS